MLLVTWVLVVVLDSNITLKYSFDSEEACNKRRDELVTKQTVGKIFCISGDFNSV